MSDRNPRASVSRIGPAVDEALPTFELIAEWQAFLDASGAVKAETRRNYRRTITNFLADILKPLTDVTEADVVGYIAHMASKGPMRGLTLRAFHSFYKWAEERDICPSPVKHLKIPRDKYGPAAYLSDADLARLLTAADEVDPRARWAFQLMYATGARLASLCAVTPEDIQDGLIYFRETKHDKPYTVPLGSKGQEAVEHLIGLLDYKPRQVGSRQRTLVGVGPGAVWEWTNLAAKAIGVRVYPHLLRHTFATKLARNPAVSQVEWVELMNHRDGSQLRRYASASAEGLRSAVERL